jgi:hypothetical protein
VPAEPSLSTVDALKAVAKKYSFKSEEACWKYLKQERRRLQQENREGNERPDSLVDDFTIPNLLRVLK